MGLFEFFVSHILFLRLKVMPLHAACLTRTGASIIRTLLIGASINEGDANGDTALIHACRAGDMDIARLLLNSGADLTKQNNRGVTALHAAVCAGHTSMVMTLLDNPLSRADSQDANGETANVVLSTQSRTFRLSAVFMLPRQSHKPLSPAGRSDSTALGLRNGQRDMYPQAGTSCYCIGTFRKPSWRNCSACGRFEQTVFLYTAF